MSTETRTESDEAAAVAAAPAEAPAAAPGLTSAKAPDVQEIEVTHQSVPELFQEQVRKRGNRPAMYFKSSGRWQPINWDQYGAAVRRVSGYLMSEGVKHGERVGILSYNRPEWHIADVATQHVGGTVVGIYLTNSAPQCQYILEHAEAPIVFVENRDQLAKILEVKKNLPKLRRIVLISGETEPDDGEAVVTWQKALTAGEAYDKEHPDDFDARWRAIKRDDLATFIYTSGTTGPPKAVMLDHGNLLWTAESIKHTIDLADPDEDVTISYLPLAHIAERMAGHILHLHNGHSIYFCERLDLLGANLAEVRPTFMFGVPRIWEKFQTAVEKQLAGATGVKGAIARWGLKQGLANVDNAVAGGAPSGGARLADRLVFAKIREALGLDRVKQLSTGAAPISEKTLRFFWALGLPLFEVYGQSEGSGPTSTNRLGHARLGTVGPAMPGDEIRIAGDGEVLMRGGNVFRGYFKDQKATDETLKDGWLQSGDVGIIEEGGFLRITDRKKDLIITAGGKNISPSNIEVSLKRQPFVGQAVAIGDRRPFMAALLTIDAEQVKALADKVGAEADGEVLAKNDKVREIFQAGVDQVNASLSNVERIKKFTILPADLSVDGGELTPTLKVKRKVVNEKYADRIESLYR
ncbi:MAG: long-chain acyl-CoA synthetase [Chloroflexota bacterium]|jgi:long-chain acyl-CoA synthetase|nr:long-chain acyl-CoA synthetase [Chloroflexota bacterium]